MIHGIDPQSNALFRDEADRKHLGARIGLTAVHHTRGSALTRLPDKSGQYARCRARPATAPRLGHRPRPTDAGAPEVAKIPDGGGAIGDRGTPAAVTPRSRFGKVGLGPGKRAFLDRGVDPDHCLGGRRGVRVAAGDDAFMSAAGRSPSCSSDLFRMFVARAHSTSTVSMEQRPDSGRKLQDNQNSFTP